MPVAGNCSVRGVCFSIVGGHEKTTSCDAAAEKARAQVRRGRDVWFKGTFGNQDEIYLHFSRTTPNGIKDIYYPWLDTRERKHRFTKYGVINDPDCTEGDASTYWWDKRYINSPVQVITMLQKSATYKPFSEAIAKLPDPTLIDERSTIPDEIAIVANNARKRLIDHDGQFRM